MTAPMLRSTFPGITSRWLFYDFGQRKHIPGIGDAYLLRNTVQNTGPMCFLPPDVTPASVHDLEPVTQTQNGKFTRIWPDRYFGSPPVKPPGGEPVEPPGGEPVEEPPGGEPVEEPPGGEPVEPPIITPPVATPTKYTIKKITRTKDFPTIVFFGVANGLRGKLVSPDGKREQPFVTGNKPEFGPGGTEAGAGVVVGDYTLIIGGDKFIVPIAGQFTKIEFEAAPATPPVEDTVVLRSILPMTRARAAELLAKLETDFKGMFRIE